MKTKICTKCGEVKNYELFCIEKRALDGHTSECKLCMSNRCREYRHSEKGKLQQKIYYIKNREKIIKKSCDWSKKNPESMRARGKRYSKRHPDRVKERHRIYNLKYRNIIAERLRKWRMNNPEKAKNANKRSNGKRRHPEEYDYYVIDRLCSGAILEKKDIPQELIESKRELIRNKRLRELLKEAS